MQHVHSDPQASVAGPLSPAGRARRDAMLPALQREVARRGVRRRLARGAAVLVPAIGLVVAGLFVFGQPLPPPAPRLVQGDGEARPATSEAGHETTLASVPLLSPAEVAAWSVIPRPARPAPPVVRVVAGDTSLVRREPVAPPPRVARLSDDGLASALRASGVDAGVVRTPLGVRIVTDQERHPHAPTAPQSRASPARPASPRAASTARSPA